MLIETTNSHDWRLAMLPYNGALNFITMYAQTIEDELFANNHSNPIEHIKVRLKRPSSIARKLIKKGYEPTVENALKYIEDIAVCRIVCLFQDDIYKIADVIQNFGTIRVTRVKDYIKNPKSTGYRSYHMHVEVPVKLLEGEKWVGVEIQLRTVAMDFWASLEHKIRYKTDKEVPPTIISELRNCSDLIEKIDSRMQILNHQIELLGPIRQHIEKADIITEY